MHLERVRLLDPSTIVLNVYMHARDLQTLLLNKSTLFFVFKIYYVYLLTYICAECTSLYFTFHVDFNLTLTRLQLNFDLTQLNLT